MKGIFININKTTTNTEARSRERYEREEDGMEMVMSIKIKINKNLLLHFVKIDEVPKYMYLEILVITPIFGIKHFAEKFLAEYYLD